MKKFLTISSLLVLTMTLHLVAQAEVQLSPRATIEINSGESDSLGPPTVTTHAGASFVITNRTNNKYVVVFDDGGFDASDELDVNESHTQVITDAGAYNFHLERDGEAADITGTVTVLAADAPLITYDTTSQIGPVEASSFPVGSVVTFANNSSRNLYVRLNNEDQEPYPHFPLGAGATNTITLVEAAKVPFSFFNEDNSGHIGSSAFYAYATRTDQEMCPLYNRYLSELNDADVSGGLYTHFYTAYADAYTARDCATVLGADFAAATSGNLPACDAFALIARALDDGKLIKDNLFSFLDTFLQTDEYTDCVPPDDVNDSDTNTGVFGCPVEQLSFGLNKNNDALYTPDFADHYALLANGTYEGACEIRSWAPLDRFELEKNICEVGPLFIQHLNDIGFTGTVYDLLYPQFIDQFNEQGCAELLVPREASDATSCELYNMAIYSLYYGGVPRSIFDMYLNLLGGDVAINPATNEVVEVDDSLLVFLVPYYECTLPTDINPDTLPEVGAGEFFENGCLMQAFTAGLPRLAQTTNNATVRALYDYAVSATDGLCNLPSFEPLSSEELESVLLNIGLKENIVNENTEDTVKTNEAVSGNNSLPIMPPDTPSLELANVFCVPNNGKGKYIQDIAPSDPRCPALRYSVAQKYIFGSDVKDAAYSLGKLDAPVKRAEMAAIATRILGETGGLVQATWAFADLNLGFIDLPPDLSGDQYWYRDYLKTTSSNRVIGGVSIPAIFKGNQGRFLAGSDVLTGEVMKILFNGFAQSNVLKDGSIPTAAEGEQWFTPFFTRAAACGASLASQGPGHPPTRGEIVDFIYQLKTNGCLTQ